MGGFSAFTSFQVFEHLCDLGLVMNHAYEILADGGVGLINVPNGKRILEQDLYHQIVCQHVNYFTPQSLCFMAANAGFDVLEINDIESMVELDLYIRKPFRRLGFDAAMERDKQTIQSIIKPFKKVSIWDAGAKCRYYSKLLDENNTIIHLWDSSENKEGLYVSGINRPVEIITKYAIFESDVIIIFASAYNNEIIASLRDKHNYTGKIVYFDKFQIKEDG